MVSPPLFQIHRFTKKSVVLSADFVVANQRCDRLPSTSAIPVQLHLHLQSLTHHIFAIEKPGVIVILSGVMRWVSKAHEIKSFRRNLSLQKSFDEFLQQ